MNTLNNLLNNGIELHTAIRMLDDYSKRIGTMNGVYKIIDINYDFSIRGKNITLQCSECGKVINRLMIRGRNKWSELIKGCSCQREKKRLEKIANQKNFQKIKKTQIFNDAKSLIGSNYGDYKIIYVENKGNNPVLILKCSKCGHIVKAPYNSIRTEAKKYKKCKKHINQIKYDESYIGRKNNYLKVIGITRLPNNRRALICECDCGNITTTQPTNWENGQIKSCGCLANSLKIEHSQELDRLRRIHSGMKQRCYNSNNHAYHNYGGRGITICQEWQDRDNFIKWALENGYSNDLSIDRIDVNGNYEPNNCRWATAKEQNNNQRLRKKGYRRKLKTAIVDGQEKPLVEWYVIYGVTAPTIAYRMKTYGLNFEDALKMPRKTNGRPRKEV